MPARGGSGRERLSGGPEGRSAARCPIRRQEAIYGYQGRVRPDPHFATCCIRRIDVMILLLILLLILFSICLWIFSLVCDVIYHACSHNLFWKGVAFYTIVGGVVGALLAAIPGFIDYVSLTNRRVKRIATTHLILNLIVVALFPFNLGIRYNASPDSETFGVVLLIIATSLLAFSGWLGGSLVYVHGVGVETPASKEQQKRVA